MPMKVSEHAPGEAIQRVANAVAQPRVSVVIPHLNTPDVLLRCLASVAGQVLDRGAVEIIVADNGSTVPLDAVRAAYPKVRIVVERAPGPGLARNAGAAIARAPVLAFIDADCRAEAGWLQAAVDAVEADPARAVVGGDVRIDFIDEANPTPIEAYEAVFAYRQRMYIERQHYSGTGNLAMGAAVFAEVGPFAGIATAEDRDWGRRAAALGFTARYVEPMRIYHPGRTDIGELQRKWQRHISHDLHDHRHAGKPMAAWYARSVAVPLSSAIHALQLLTSPRIIGVAARLKGVGVLFQIRLWRCAEMLRAARNGQSDAAAQWNRTP